MSADFQYDIFLSHNSKDKPTVRRLAARLKRAGLRVWLDEWIIKPGDIISLKVDEGLEHSRVLLLCISPNALASGWLALERSTAVHRDPANEVRRFDAAGQGTGRTVDAHEHAVVAGRGPGRPAPFDMFWTGACQRP